MLFVQSPIPIEELRQVAAMIVAREQDVTHAQSAIEWARDRSPTLARITAFTAASGLLRGRRIAVVTHLEPKAASFICRMADTGAEVLVSGSNPHTTRADVVQALRNRGLQVFVSEAASENSFESDLRNIAEAAPEIILDDGAELTRRMLVDRNLPKPRGVSEQTTTGVTRLREFGERGLLDFPAIAANDAACKRLFDNRHATGQGFVHAFMRLTNLTMLGKVVAVFGYGPVGRGVAQYAHAFGARICVVEIDPVRRLTANIDGFRVLDAQGALPLADILVTATGRAAVVRESDFPLLKNGAVLCNVGHWAGEIEVKNLERVAHSVREVRQNVVAYTLSNDRIVHVLTAGELVNIAGAEGHPIEIMDLSFSVQVLSAYLLAKGNLANGIQAFPTEFDSLIAREALDSLGITADA